MNRITVLLSAVLAVGGFVTVHSIAGAAENAQVGTAKVTLLYIYAAMPNGSADPAHDADCKAQLSSIPSKYLNMPVSTRYSIDPKTLTMSAHSSFPSPVATQPLQLAVDLNALGIANSYSFGDFRPAVLPGAYAVLFSVNTKYADAKSTFVVFGKDKSYNCVISSAKAPFKAAESAKYGAEEKS